MHSSQNNQIAARIESIIQNNKVFRISSEVTHLCQPSAINTTNNERKSQLQEILDKLTKSSAITRMVAKTIANVDAKLAAQAARTMPENASETSYITEITSFNDLDKYIYAQRWPKLQPFQKEKKILEYLIEHYDKEQADALEPKFKSALKKDYYKTTKNVTYDSSAQKIIAISLPTNDD